MHTHKPSPSSHAHLNLTYTTCRTAPGCESSKHFFFDTTPGWWSLLPGTTARGQGTPVVHRMAEQKAAGEKQDNLSQ